MSDAPIPRLSRLAGILTILQSNKLVTSTQLANRYDVSIRTIYRDIKALEKSGIPIYVKEGKGYSLVDGYTLPPIMFSESEANALITAQQIIFQNKDLSLITEYGNAIRKIKAVLNGKAKDNTEVLEKRVVHIKNLERHTTSNSLIQIQTAITSKHILRITYTALYDGKTTIRMVEPMALYHTQENWIMIAWCRMRSDYRDFRLDRIEKLTPTSNPFTDRNFDLLTYFRRNLS